MALLVYLLAAATAGMLDSSVYYSLRMLHSTTLGRYVARLVAACIATSAFISVCHLIGYARLLGRGRHVASWGEDCQSAVAFGIALATLWPLMRDRARFWAGPDLQPLEPPRCQAKPAPHRRKR
jgi:hypothetical protein